MSSQSLDLRQAFAGREVMITGVTGFLGKVALAMLLDRYPEVGRVHVLVRPRAGGTADDRFFGKVVTAPPFNPLREKHGEGFDAFLRQKCAPLAGDVTDAMFGLTEAELASLDGKLACVINSAGLVTFNPSLELALDVNTRGAMNGAALCKRTGATLVHVSTCFVAGTRRGPVFEDETMVGSFPKLAEGDLPGEDFSLENELRDCEKLVERVRAQADDSALLATFRKAAIDRLEAEGRDPQDAKALRLAIGRERKLWQSGQLIEAGMARAKHWGWPNTYTYSKALGEQAIAKSGCKSSIVRPAIVESALRFPFPGWNEGFTTSAPLAFMGLKGHRAFPAGHKLVLDLIPVDLVCAGLIGIAGAACVDRAERVYQLASGDVNPFYIRRAVELVALYKRRFYKERDAKEGATDSLSLSRAIDRGLEPYPVSRAIYGLTSAPLFKKLVTGARGLIKDQGPRWGAPRLSAFLAQADQKLEQAEKQLTVLEMTWDLFLPFVAGERFIFSCAHTRALWAQLSERDRELIPWDPEALDWRVYWLDVHMRGLEEWVFPGLEEERDKLKREIPQSKDLLQLLAAAVHAYGPRTALRYFAGPEAQDELTGSREDRVSYRELGVFSDRCGQGLQAAGVKPGDRVLLLSENRPEWAMAYFGILKAGATAVPLDAAMTQAEIDNCARAANATLLLASPKQLDRLGLGLPVAQSRGPGVPQQPQAASREPQAERAQLAAVSLVTALRGAPEDSKLPPLKKSAAPDEVASLLFTSGTTGKPKGVLLTHRNLASMAAKLAGLFDVRVGEGVLSVLPLHHTFEFSCGLLTPLTLGAEITYLDELTADRLAEALQANDITAMIGVPALWQLLHRRLTGEVASRPTAVRAAVEAAMALHGELRNRTDFNVGKLLFWPVHKKFGGKLRLLVSGGSALPADVQETFHQLGFDLTEGYGLTEAAPVLAVTVPENRRQTGSVGPAIPGVEIRIKDPDAEGVGEVIAKGPNVMAGYLDDPESTRQVLIDGWLHTGDLGRLTPEGNLALVGRKKDVILDASGKNVYPDEVEELYGADSIVKELCVVGLPDEAGHERIACLAVPRTTQEGESREQVRKLLHEHFAKVSLSLPFWKRIKVLHLWDADLPRTASRKVKRPLVVTELQRLERAGEAMKKLGDVSSGAARPAGWLFELVAELSRKPRHSISAETRFVADLGFDSLLTAELVSALEKAGVTSLEEGRIATLQTVGDLEAMLAAAGQGREKPQAASRKPEADLDAEIKVPDFIASLGRTALASGQRLLFEGFFDLSISGQANVPANAPFLVAANHSSHLDAGLVKQALGEQGARLASLAARDYFFDTPWKRAWFGSFTNLVPLDRHGSLKESLRNSAEALRLGYHLLIFPEGTRSPDGKLQEFKPAIAYLSFAANADILPMYLDGAFDAMPKGSFGLDPRKKRKLAVRIGPPLRVADLRRATAGLSRSGAHREVTRLVQLAIEALRDGTPPPAILAVDAARTLPAPDLEGRE